MCLHDVDEETPHNQVLAPTWSQILHILSPFHTQHC